MLVPVFRWTFARPALAAAITFAALPAAPVHAEVELRAGGAVLLQLPLQLAADFAGGVGLMAAAGVATAGDALALVDQQTPARVLLRGAPSTGLRGIAYGLSFGSTTLLERLRGEDIERWPEPTGAYLEVDPFVGRLNQLLDGLSALSMLQADILDGPALAVTRAIGATRQADEIERERLETRISRLGPEPEPVAPTPPPAGS